MAADPSSSSSMTSASSANGGGGDGGAEREQGWANNSTSCYHQYHFHRYSIILVVVSAMRSHLGQNGVLSRVVDIVACHLNQPTEPTNTTTNCTATRAAIASVDKQCYTPQGSSTVLLALVATTRHVSSLAALAPLVVEWRRR